MRHRKAKTKLGRSGAHRHALYNNLLSALVEHGKIETTERKARELRSLAEKTVTQATSLGEVILKEPSDMDSADRAKYVHRIRLVSKRLRDRQLTNKLFRDWAPRYLNRPGGYTRMFKTGNRRGDAAPMAILEFIPDELPGASKETKSPAA